MNMGVVGVLLGTVLSFMASAIAVPIAVNKEICIHMRDNGYNIPTSFIDITFLNILLPYDSSCCNFFSILNLHPFGV